MTRCGMVFYLLPVCILAMAAISHGMTEMERMDEHFKRYGDDWPPEYIPNTPGWKKIMDKRFRQVLEVDDRGQKYDGFIQVGDPCFCGKGRSCHVKGKDAHNLHLSTDLPDGIFGSKLY
jgi:hypothetical protein